MLHAVVYQVDASSDEGTYPVVGRGPWLTDSSAPEYVEELEWRSLADYGAELLED